MKNNKKLKNNLSSWIAITASSILSVFATYFLYIAYLVTFILTFKNPPDDTCMCHIFFQNNLYQLLTISALISLASGFLTAILTRRREISNAFITYLVSTSLFFASLWFIVAITPPAPPHLPDNFKFVFPGWYFPATFILPLLAYLLGGYIGSITNRKNL